MWCVRVPPCIFTGGALMADDAVVLIIDDDEAVRGAFRHVLQKAGFTVLEADDGESGLAVCAERAPGVVFVDLRMPRMDGLAVLNAMKERHPDTPVVVISGGRKSTRLNSRHL